MTLRKRITGLDGTNTCFSEIPFPSPLSGNLVSESQLNTHALKTCGHIGIRTGSTYTISS